MRLPLLTLLSFFAAAALAAIGGTRLARREWQERMPADRAVIREFAEEWQTELAGLSDFFEQDLLQIASSLQASEPWKVRGWCNTVYGVREALLFADDQGARPRVVKTNPADQDRFPEVILAGREAPDPRKSAALVLPAPAAGEDSNHPGMQHGWLRSPDRKFGVFWWRRNPRFAVVLLIDWREVALRTNVHFAEWFPAPYAQVRSSGTQMLVEGPGGERLGGLDRSLPRPADLILPIQSRLGSYQLIAWDRVLTRTGYDQSVVTVAMTVSACLAALGLLLFRQQIRAQRLAEQRVSFVNRVSHELGTPLTNILLNLDLATEAIARQPDEARRRLSLITEEMQRLSRLVSNVLTFSRGERGILQLNETRCVPDEIIEAVLRQFAPALSRRGVVIEFHGEADQTVLLDADALTQIIGNLVSNVEKYAADGKWLRVVTRYEPGWLSVSVADRGAGIPAGDSRRIFQPFERVSSRVNEGASGTGLGLSIARDLAIRMAGRIDLTSSGATGSVFTLKVPAATALSAPSVPPALLTHPSAAA